MSELYVCKQYDAPYERVCAIISTLEEHDNQVRAATDNERARLLAFICKKYNIPLVDMNCTIDEFEYLKLKEKE